MRVGSRPNPNVPTYVESNSDIDSDDNISSSTTSRSSIYPVTEGAQQHNDDSTPLTDRASQGRRWDPSIDFNRLGAQLITSVQSFFTIIRDRVSNFITNMRDSGLWARSRGSYDFHKDDDTVSTTSLDSYTTISDITSSKDTTSLNSFHSVSSRSSSEKTFPVYTQEQLQQFAQEGVTNLVHSRPYVSNGPSIKFPDQLGGHGDVGFLQGTNIVFKQNLTAQEAKTYKLLSELKSWLQDPQPSSINIPESLKGISRSEMKQLLDNKDLLLSSLPFPIAMAESEGAAAVAIKNVNMYQSEEGSFYKVSSKGVIDVKLGRKTMSLAELKAHYPGKTKGISFLRKIVTNGVLPMLRGTNSRGYEVIPQATGMKRLFMAKQASDNLIQNLSARLTAQQAANLSKQVTDLTRAMRILPITFVGSSMLIALPDASSTNTIPQVGLVDFGHPVFSTEVTVEGPITEKVYGELKDNYMEAISKLQSQIEKISSRASIR